MLVALLNKSQEGGEDLPLSLADAVHAGEVSDNVFHFDGKLTL